MKLALRAAVFLCVTVSLWQGPIPWLHSHSDDAISLDPGILIQHSEVWHPSSEEPHAGWHIHFAALSDIVRGSGCPVPSEDETESASLLTAVVSNGHVEAQTETAWPESRLMSSSLANHDLPACDEPASCRQFLAVFAASHRLQVLLCIARC